MSFLVLPLFALANAGVTFSGGIVREVLTSHVAWGILLGLVVGKPLGTWGFSRTTGCAFGVLPSFLML